MAEDRLKDYVPVNDRLMKFWEDHPNGRIATEILKWELDDKGIRSVLIGAQVFGDRDKDAFPIATGHAYEKATGPINTNSAVENGETSAVGRALALAGYEIKKAIASQEEMRNAQMTVAQNYLASDNPDAVKVFGGTLVDGEWQPHELEMDWSKCYKCGEKLEEKVQKYCQTFYGKPLCRQHQVGADKIK